ncbi:cyclin-O [Takifugu flavidus]|uniref:G2/mitotic-specific cyclin-B2 n=1 Tax=Takifugu flavidus TaxID=433684 RepID=A0A5C6MZY5_9TELE|nr:cyclin-O [Takifugu flavidus]TWW60299.1 Cyclin-O protein B [Takifugu flavidus]
MVAPAEGGCGSGTLHRRTPTTTAAPPSDPQKARRRKQKFMSKLCDSGFEEDLAPSPSPSPVRIEVLPLRPHAGQLPTWFLQYGDIGYRIQKEKEAHFHPCRSLEQQPQLTAEARCTLVSWLISLHKYLRLSFESCCLAVNIVDRFLVSTPVAADCFQLVGAAALLLASKQVEVCSPRISHLLSFCCDAFTKEQLCNLECLILLRLNFRLDAPTLAFFLDYYTNYLDASRLESGCRFPADSSLAQKVCELSLADYAFNKYSPSVIAGSALWLTSDLMGGQWAGELGSQQISAQTSGYSENFLIFPNDESQGVRRSLALECKDKLKLLVSLNKDMLETICTL